MLNNIKVFINLPYSRKPPKGKSLAEVNPELAKQWHSTKNGNLTPFDVTTGSNEKVWWKCVKGDDHEWEASIKNRSKGQGCSVCRGFTIVPSNSLAKLNPELARDWHPTKNSNKTPFNVGIGSVKEVWWKCDKGENHEWKAAIRERVSGGKKCSFCPKPVRKLKIGESLAEKRPELAKQWHPTKNGDLTPHDFPLFPKSREIIWWKCNKSDDHEWQTSINNRAVNSICPFCSGKRASSSNSLATLNPELAKQWHPKKNGGLRPDNVTEHSGKKVWWQCSQCNLEWKADIGNRSKGVGCPNCAEHGFNPYKLAFFYIRDVKVKKKRAIKFGITNQLTGKRETKQKRGVDGSLETIFKIKVKGHLAMSIENKCKIIYGRYGYLTKEELPDGFTETIKYSEESLNKIKSIVDEVLTEKAKKKN